MLLSDEATNQSVRHCGLQNREDTLCLPHMREKLQSANKVWRGLSAISCSSISIRPSSRTGGRNIDWIWTPAYYVLRVQYLHRRQGLASEKRLKNFYRDFIFLFVVVFIFSTLFFLLSHKSRRNWLGVINITQNYAVNMISQLDTKHINAYIWGRLSELIWRPKAKPEAFGGVCSPIISPGLMFEATMFHET